MQQPREEASPSNTHVAAEIEEGAGATATEASEDYVRGLKKGLEKGEEKGLKKGEEKGVLKESKRSDIMTENITISIAAYLYINPKMKKYITEDMRIAIQRRVRSAYPAGTAPDADADADAAAPDIFECLKRVEALVGPLKESAEHVRRML